MKKLVGTGLGALLALWVSGAGAAEVEGWVQRVNPPERMFVLLDGTEIWLAEGLVPERLEPEIWVRVVYEVRDGKKIATVVQEQSNFAGPHGVKNR
jgi:hypothetical protein